jgi:tartronate-semialdehyde synthase
MAKMRAVDAAVRIGQGRLPASLRRARRRDQPFYSALKKHGGISHVLARHVEGASHMAEGYTRAKAGNIGLCIGTSGPAGTDMITGLYSAQADSIPILCITGQAPRPALQGRLPGRRHRIHRQARHQMGRHRARAGPGAARVPAGLPPDALRPPRPGADRPAFDVQMAEIDFDPIPTRRCRSTSRRHPRPDRKGLRHAQRGQRPLLTIGGGVINADAAALAVEFAELTGVPVIPTLMGWGAIADDHPLMAGMVGLQTSHRYGNATLLASDFVLGIGNRWANRHTGSIDVYTKGRKFVHVDIEPTQIGRVFGPDYGIVSDAGPR